MRDLCCRGVLLLLLVLLAGCATSAGDAQRQARRGTLLLDTVDARDLGYVVNWSQDLRLAEGDDLAFAEVLDDLVVTVQRPSNVVTALSARTGELRWRRMLGTDTDRLYQPARAGDLIVVSSDDRVFLLKATNGDLEAVHSLDTVVATGPVVSGNYAIFGGIDGTVFAHDLNAGYRAWRYQLTDRILTPPLLLDNHVFAADGRGTYALLNLEGALSWRGRTFGAVVATPVADESTIYVASTDRSLYALNRSTGSDRWVYRSTRPLTRSPEVSDLLVLLPVPDDGLVALEAETGEMRWRLDEPFEPVTRLDDNLLLAGDRRLRLVSPETGNTLEEVPTLPLSDVLEGPEESLILVSPAGRLLRINPAQ